MAATLGSFWQQARRNVAAGAPSPFIQAVQAVELRLRRGLGPAYYHTAGLWRPSISRADRLGHVNDHEYHAFLDRMNDPAFQKVSQHKITEKAVLELALSCPEKQAKFALELAWAGEDHVQVNLATVQTRRVKLSHSTQERGLFRPPRIHVATRYPTGLAVAWSYVYLDVQGLVYPAPVEKAFQPSGHARQEALEDGVEIAGGSSDFSGVRDYQQGDALRIQVFKDTDHVSAGM